ncbi:MAG: glycosyltransferase [Spirochaetales bacterium]|nr:glycosyltransferase [Spirochaetales bacterium]
MTTYSLIVTYGNRFALLEKTISACLSEGIGRVVVVDNNSDKESRAQLQNLEAESPVITVLYQDRNLGSAGGYKKGLEYIRSSCSDCDFIWLLDDDNKPVEDSLRQLKDYWQANNLDYHKTALMSYRPDRTAYRIAIRRGNPDYVLERPDSFWGFHLLSILGKVIRVLKRRMGKTLYRENEAIRSGQISVATYGGMFFHKSLLDTIGYPDEDYYLYADDHQWSYRITKRGGAIFLLLDSVLEDIDRSWNVRDNTSTVFDVIGKGSGFRIYYTVRNRILFEKENLVQKYPLYRLNLFLFETIYRLISRKKGYGNREILRRAISDGLKGVKGKVPDL